MPPGVYRASPYWRFVGILTHLVLRLGSDASPMAKALPLYTVLVAGVPLVLSLTRLSFFAASLAPTCWRGSRSSQPYCFRNTWPVRSWC